MSTGTTYIADQQRIFTVTKENNNFQSLINLLQVKEGEHRGFPCLNRAIDQLNFNFYDDLFPQIAQWASDHSQAKSFEPLVAGKTASIVYTAAQARYILANAFFLNTTAGYGTIDLKPLYNSLFAEVSVERIRCLIEYFHLSLKEDNNREISIERYSCKTEFPDWCKQDVLIQSSKFNVFTDRMEDANDARGFVDFANKYIHIHRIIPSATQEEVLFSCCPEAFVSILVCDTLQDDEVVILRGCKRFIEYTGYLDTFAYKDHYHQQNPAYIQDILVMDACYSQHFTPENIDRDLGKAWATFQKSKNEIIVTGNWGCGAFGGDSVFKFLQQVCAAIVLGDDLKRIDYSLFGNAKLASELKHLLENLEKNQKTVADVYHMMIEYDQPRQLPGHRPKFSVYVDQWLNSS